MNVFDAQRLALDLMRQHGLTDQGWSFYFDRARCRHGRCSYVRRVITLSRPLTEINQEAEVRDTVLHEIAHALTPGAHHGARWRSCAVRIGARPIRCAMGAQQLTPGTLLECPGCQRRIRRFRHNRGLYHVPCGPDRGVFRVVME